MTKLQWPLVPERRTALYQTGFHNTYDVNLVEVGPGQVLGPMATDAARGYI